MPKGRFSSPIGEIERLSPQGALVSTFGQDLLTANDLALDSVGSTLYVSDGAAHRIQMFNVEGVSPRLIGGFGTDVAGLNFPRGLAISEDRELHVVDAGNARIQVYGLDGSFRRSYGGRQDESGQLHAPRDIVFDPAVRAIVSDTMSARLAWFDSRGVFLKHSQLRLDDGESAIRFTWPSGPAARCTQQSFEEARMWEGTLAEIRLFAGTFAPKYWAYCDGQILSLSQNIALFSLLGTTFGGNGQTTFALPRLPDLAPGVRYVICIQGIFPSRPDR